METAGIVVWSIALLGFAFYAAAHFTSRARRERRRHLLGAMRRHEDR